jgi:protein translocase SecG subunit
MKTLFIFQIAVSIILIILVLLTNQGASVGGAFGGGENQVWRNRRGPEKFFFVLTIIFAIIFIGLAVANIIV